MKQVISGLSNSRKYVARLGDLWAITSGYDVPRFVDAKTLRSGELGLRSWGDDEDSRPTYASTGSDVDSDLEEFTYYNVKVVAVDKRFVTPLGYYRMSDATLPLVTPLHVGEGGAGTTYTFNIKAHTQQDVDNTSGNPTEIDAATKLWVYLSSGATANEATYGTYFKLAELDNEDQTYELNDLSGLTTSDYDSDNLPPPYGRYCLSAFNRLWIAGGIVETRGKVTVLSAAPTIVVGNTSGDDQTYFSAGMVGAKFTVGDEQSYTISAVDADLQKLTLSEAYDGTALDSTQEFIVDSDYGLYWCSKDNPHKWPLENYIPLPGRTTGLRAMHRSVIVFTEDEVLRFTADAPEQGYVLIPGEGGTNAPDSVVVVGDRMFFWDGSKFAVTDGTNKVSLTHNRMRELHNLIDRDLAYRIVGAFDPYHRTIHWYYPLVDGRVGCHNGIELHVDTGDIYPVWRPDVATMWTEGNELFYGNTSQFAQTGPGIWRLDHDVCGDGVAVDRAFKGTVLREQYEANSIDVVLEGLDDGLADMECIPVTAIVDEATHVTKILATGIGRQQIQLYDDDLGPLLDQNGLVIPFYGGQPYFSLFDDDSDSVQLQDGTDIVPVQYGEHTLIFPASEDMTAFETVGRTIYVGISPVEFGPKWLDFGSPRYRHKTYDLQLTFSPPGDAVDIVVDLYEELSATPVKHFAYTIAATDSRLEVPFRYHETFIMGFGLRIFGRVPLKIQSYDITWATIR